MEALYDREAAHAVTLRNLLQRRGYQDLDAVRTEGRDEGQAEALRRSILDVLEARGLTVDEVARAAINGCRDLDRLRQWLTRSATCGSSDEVFEP